MSILVHRRASNSNLRFSDSIHPLVQKIYNQRAISTSKDLELGLKNLITPEKFKGMKEAVDLLLRVLKKQQRILIVADFDADGATSCVLAINILKQLGIKNIDYIVPNRFEYGYGLTPELVESGKSFNPDLIITVDNGISSVEGVKVANSAGIDVLITDHHIAPEILPEAQAVVNPNQLGCDFPSKCIAGVGVIFYLMLALRSRLREEQWFESHGITEPNLADQLDLVALGTIADVVALDRNNRILVDEGIKRIRSGKTRPGINALLRVADRNGNRLKTSDLGFSLAPRLNAAGRLEDMSTGIECLLTNSENEAYQLALKLDGINQDRKQIELEMREQAFESLKGLSINKDNLPAALCLFDERWHQGVVGIVASRVKDKFYRPVIAFAQVDDSDNKPTELKGSARSVQGFHIRDALASVAITNPGLITKFGGHAMAAGLSLDKDNLDIFTKAFAHEAQRLLSEDQLQARLLSDGLVESEWLTIETAYLIESAGPWGQEFEEPLFDGRFVLVRQKRLGENHLKMVLSPIQDEEREVDAIAFNVSEEDWPKEGAAEIEIAYRLEVNEFRGNETLQLKIEKVLSTA
ncbi:MAG: single-stranded-DNA-specific exonuclease RecJ [Gammaproteobacteria bacterium]|nr:single-stranded-DNA-specific exonuclease RecJ [Gammaproteobacteria bacterium]